MADKKTSAESAASALDGSELVRIVQSGASVKTTAQAIADLGGGGSGGFFHLESGSSPVKVSAFSAATAPDGTELIPGVQGAVNVAFTTAQLLTGANAATSSNLNGTSLEIQAGMGDGSGVGGSATVQAGYGNGSGGGGGAYLGAGGSSIGPGGHVIIGSGSSYGGDNNGGDVKVLLSTGFGAGRNGQFLIQGLPTSDPGVSHALYVDPVTHIVHWK